LSKLEQRKKRLNSHSEEPFHARVDATEGLQEACRTLLLFRCSAAVAGGEAFLPCRLRRRSPEPKDTGMGRLIPAPMLFVAL
jgi:hypothetical protein